MVAFHAGGPLTVTLLEPARIPAAAAVLAAAMEVDPMYRHLFPDAGTRPAALADLFRRNLALHVDRRCAWVAGEPVHATGTLRPPGAAPVGWLAMLRHGALPFAATHGVGALRRLLWTKRTYEALERDAAGGGPHGYLHMMAVAPERQGQGRGSLLLSALLDGVAHPVVLTTHLPQNLVFYGRFGFETVGEETLRPPDGAPGWTVWSMRREA